MGYDITIGLKMALDDGHAMVVAETNLDAPAYPGDDDSHHVNVRRPGYVAWEAFCTQTGLHDLFFNKRDGLLAEHPGIVDLKPEHLEAVREAVHRHVGHAPLDEWRPGYGEGLDYTLARLLWLSWWMTWALRQGHPAAVQNW